MTRIGTEGLAPPEIEERRLTLMYSDLVGSTELSGRLEPETYMGLLRDYRAVCRNVIETRFGGHVLHDKGDGALSVFGFPVAHENDAERAVRAGLALVRSIAALGADRGEALAMRVGVHKGTVLIELAENDVYGLAANVGSRFEQLADPGAVVISEEVRQLVTQHFVFHALPPTLVKGVAEPVLAFRVLVERTAPERVWSSPLVEREAQLRQLADAKATAERRPARPVAMLITGAAGVGKSRLLAALDVQPTVALYGSPIDEDAPFRPFRALIETRAGVGPESAPGERLERLTAELAAHGVADRVALLAPILALDPSAGYAPAAAQGQLLNDQVTQAVFDYIVACLWDGPSVIVAEDAHCFDSSSASLLAALSRTAPGGTLIVATSRTSVPGGWTRIALEPLSDEGCMTLMSALAPGLADDRRRALVARSDGLPFFVEELARARPAFLPVPVPGSVPEPLYEPLVAHLYMAPEALPVAAAVAAAGVQPERSLLAAALRIPDEELDVQLTRLIEFDILVPHDTRFRFRHDLLREAAYELQPRSWRRQVHDRLADVLSEEEVPAWHLLASHLERAERWLEAATAYQETAEQARRLGVMVDARGHLDTAMTLLVAAPAGAERNHREIQLRLRRGFLTMSDEGAASTGAADDFEGCRTLVDADPHGDGAFSALISLWAFHLARAELERSREVSTLLRAALDGRREEFRPGNRAGFGILDWYAGHFDAARETLELANAELDARGGADDVVPAWFVPNDQTAAMRVHLGLARFVAGDLEGAQAELARAHARAKALEYPQGPWSATYACWLESWMWAEAGRLDRAAAAAAEASALSDRHGFETWGIIATTQAMVVESLTAKHDLAAAVEGLDGLTALWEAAGMRIFLPYYLTTIGALLAEIGEREAARARYTASLDLAAETSMRFYDAETRRRLAHLDPDPEGGLRAALALARSQGAVLFERRIEADLRA